METLYVNESPGGLVNRPRYTLNIYVVIVLYLWVLYVIDVIYEDFLWYGIEVHYPSLNWLVTGFCFFKSTGGSFDNTIDTTELKIKAKDVYGAFIEATELVYAGIHRIRLVNSSGVLHPVDHFIKQFYDRYFPKQVAFAMAKYKRTNPTLQLRLNHLEHYAKPRIENIPHAEIDAAVETIIEDVLNHNDFSLLSDEINDFVNFEKFSELQIDLSSASGYPFKQGRKKREDCVEATMEAHKILHDDVAFDAYLSDHVWYTTGRARLQLLEKDDAGRLIIYAGYTYLLVAMLVLQPWSRFMNASFSWCGVGFSWMNGGAGKFAKHFKADKGYAPVGFRYVSLDISGWDTKLHPDLMASLETFYSRLLKACKIKEGFAGRFIRLVHGMIDSTILMPLGHAFRVNQGMKSGWGATANDNTLLHEVVFRCVMNRVGFIHHVLYGDDNFMLVPDVVTDGQLVAEYARFGLLVKEIHSSRFIGDVDFLSKKIMYRDGYYYVYRDAIETHARLIMPEEMDPRRRDRPDVLVACERVLGHLLDNPFNSDVRKVCYNLLERFHTDYSVDFIEVHDDSLKRHPWRMFDRDKIPKRFPTVPSMKFIEDLYGVPMPERLRVLWPELPDFIPMKRNARDDNDILYDSAAGFANDVLYRVSKMVGKQSRALIRKLSPYAQPSMCYGFHAARFEFAVKYFDIHFNNVLDLGSHPGACAASALKYCNEVQCVSKRPRNDTRDFCPYIAKGKEVKIIIADANTYIPRRPFDLQHDDVDIVGARSVEDDIQIGLGMIERARVNVRSVEQSLFTLKEISWEVREALYEAYRAYGHIDMVKPLFSNPWKSEFMVYLKRSTKPRIKKSAFNRMFNAFLNSMAASLFVWADVLTNTMAGFNGVGNVEPYPLQTSSYEKIWIRPWAPD